MTKDVKEHIDMVLDKYQERAEEEGIDQKDIDKRKKEFEQACIDNKCKTRRQVLSMKIIFDVCDLHPEGKNEKSAATLVKPNHVYSVACTHFDCNEEVAERIQTGVDDAISELIEYGPGLGLKPDYITQESERFSSEYLTGSTFSVLDALFQLPCPCGGFKQCNVDQIKRKTIEWARNCTHNKELLYMNKMFNSLEKVAAPKEYKTHSNSIKGAHMDDALRAHYHVGCKECEDETLIYSGWDLYYGGESPNKLIKSCKMNPIGQRETVLNNLDTFITIQKKISTIHTIKEISETFANCNNKTQEPIGLICNDCGDEFDCSFRAMLISNYPCCRNCNPPESIVEMVNKFTFISNALNIDENNQSSKNAIIFLKQLPPNEFATTTTLFGISLNCGHKITLSTNYIYNLETDEELYDYVKKLRCVKCQVIEKICQGAGEFLIKFKDVILNAGVFNNLISKISSPSYKSSTADPKMEKVIFSTVGCPEKQFVIYGNSFFTADCLTFSENQPLRISNKYINEWPGISFFNQFGNYWVCPQSHWNPEDSKVCSGCSGERFGEFVLNQGILNITKLDPTSKYIKVSHFQSYDVHLGYKNDVKIEFVSSLIQKLIYLLNQDSFDTTIDLEQLVLWLIELILEEDGQHHFIKKEVKDRDELVFNSVLNDPNKRLLRIQQEFTRLFNINIVDRFMEDVVLLVIYLILNQNDIKVFVSNDEYFTSFDYINESNTINLSNYYNFTYNDDEIVNYEFKNQVITFNSLIYSPYKQEFNSFVKELDNKSLDGKINGYHTLISDSPVLLKSKIGELNCIPIKGFNNDQLSTVVVVQSKTTNHYHVFVSSIIEMDGNYIGSMFKQLFGNDGCSVRLFYQKSINSDSRIFNFIDNYIMKKFALKDDQSNILKIEQIKIKI